jgi:5'-nucleotidase
LNVNIPALPLDEIKGFKYARQAEAKWEEEFEERVDPRGKQYFWLTGKFKNYDEGDTTDEWALENGYVSIVPVKFDLTDHENIQYLNQNWEL